MSKAILVMDMPENCCDCTFCDEDCRCVATEYREIVDEMDISEERTEWCPIEPVKKYAIWSTHKVIGYIDLTQEQADELNSIKGIGVYFGFDKVTNPEKYEEGEQE